MGGPAPKETTTVEAVKTTTVTEGGDTTAVTDEAIVASAESENTPVS